MRKQIYVILCIVLVGCIAIGHTQERAGPHGKSVATRTESGITQHTVTTTWEDRAVTTTTRPVEPHEQVRLQRHARLRAYRDKAPLLRTPMEREQAIDDLIARGLGE